MGSTADVVIVGAGHNGLVAAYYLARAGLDVELLERRSIVGGGCVTEELLGPGYHFSTCASFAWMLHEKVFADLELTRHGLRWQAPDPDPVFLYPDDVCIPFRRDPELTVANIAKLNARDGEAYRAWLALLDRVRALLAPFLVTDPPTQAELTAHAESLGERELLERLQSSSIGEFVEQHFEDDRVRVALAPVLDAGDPWLPGSAFTSVFWSANQSSVLPHVLIDGGMGALSAAIAAAATEAGARIRTDAEVTEILVDDDGRARGVALADGGEIASRLVVSNADPKRTLGLLPDGALPAQTREKISGKSTRGGSFKLHTLVSELPDLSAYYGRPATDREAASLRILPSLDQYRRAYEQAMAGHPPDEPMIGNISVHSVYDPSAADGPLHTLQSWIMYAPPQLADGSWDERNRAVGEAFIDYITRFIPNLRSSIVDWRLHTPLDIERRIGMTDGNIRHIDMLPGQFMEQRKAGRSAYESHLRGLYLCGSGTHPGGEVTGLPGHNCAAAILRDALVTA